MSQNEIELRELLRVVQIRNDLFDMPKSKASEGIKFYFASESYMKLLHGFIFQKENQAVLEFISKFEKETERIKRTFDRKPESEKKYKKLGKWFSAYNERYLNPARASNYYRKDVKTSKRLAFESLCPWDIHPDKTKEVMVDLAHNFKRRQINFYSFREKFENNKEVTPEYKYSHEKTKISIKIALENDEKIRRMTNDKVADTILKKYIENGWDAEIYGIPLKELEYYNAELFSYFN